MERPSLWDWYQQAIGSCGGRETLRSLSTDLWTLISKRVLPLQARPFIGILTTLSTMLLELAHSSIWVSLKPPATV